MDKRILRDVPVIADLAKRFGDERDHYAICDLPGLASFGDDAIKARVPYVYDTASSWAGGMSTAQSIKCIREGDLSGVARSEAFLSKLESLTFVTPKYRTVDDVVGSFPNIPNLIAGVPCAMRRRVRQSSAVAPLSIFADLTSSAAIGADALAARGAAILALVRLLSNMRPVELWGVIGVGPPGGQWICCRLETAPLDLARVAHVLTHPSVPRAVMYPIAQHLFRFGGGWPYGGADTSKRYGAAIMGRVIDPSAEVLFIPPVHLNDESITSPETWLRDQINKHGGKTVEAA